MPPRAGSRPTSQTPQWQTVPYIAENGACDVLDYLEELKTKKLRSWHHFENLRKEIEERGPFALGPPYWEGLGDGLFEISWGRHRIYCSVEPTNQVVMFLAVHKLWPKFRSDHRKLCNSRRKDFQSAEYDQEHRELKYRAYLQRRGRNESV